MAWSAGVPPVEEETPPKMGAPLTAWNERNIAGVPKAVTLSHAVLRTLARS